MHYYLGSKIIFTTSSSDFRSLINLDFYGPIKFFRLQAPISMGAIIGVITSCD